MCPFIYVTFYRLLYLRRFVFCFCGSDEYSFLPPWQRSRGRLIIQPSCQPHTKKAAKKQALPHAQQSPRQFLCIPQSMRIKIHRKGK